MGHICHGTTPKAALRKAPASQGPSRQSPGCGLGVRADPAELALRQERGTHQFVVLINVLLPESAEVSGKKKHACLKQLSIQKGWGWRASEVTLSSGGAGMEVTQRPKEGRLGTQGSGPALGWAKLLSPSGHLGTASTVSPEATALTSGPCGS